MRQGLTDEQYADLESALRPRLTAEFLATLVEALRIDGHSSDFVETSAFVRNVFHIAGREPPSLEPY